MTDVQIDIAARRRALASGNMYGVISMLAWSAGFPAAEALLVDWPPLALITTRFVMAVAILIPIWAMLDGIPAVLSARWARGTWVGSIGFGLGAYLLLLSQSLTDPVTVALIASSTPLVATLLEMAGGGRQLTRNFALGLVATVIGGLIATSALAPAQLGLGAACAILSVVLFTWGSQVAVRDFPELSPIGRTTITLAGGMMLTGVALGLGHLGGFAVLPRAPVGSAQIWQLLVYAVAGMALSQAMWIASVGRLGVAMASFHINLAPFYVMVILLALGADWSWPQAAGALVVAVGVLLAQRP